VSLAWLSVGALVLAVALSCTSAINVGILAMALALLVGVGFGGLSPGAVIEGFPSDLLVTLVGVTLLFAIAQTNGTLARITARAIRLCRGHAGALPFMFFGLGLALATIGAGATPASALLAGPAMAVAARAGISPFQMAVMAGNGALAGTLSPFAPTGLVANGVMEQIGLGGYEWYTFAWNALAHAVVGVGGFFAFGGWRLFRPDAAHAAAHEPTEEPLERRHWLTTAGIGALIVTVVGFGVDVGMAALIIVAVLVLLQAGDEAAAIKQMPWGVILMVTGVTVLIVMVRDAGGLELFTAGVARVSSPSTLAPIMAFGAGVISVYSSTSGVVLPAFLPMVPDLAQRVIGVNPLDLAWALAVGASLVDLSSLSTVGALFMAAAAAGTDIRRLFNQLLAWGFSMSVAGALIAWLWFV